MIFNYSSMFCRLPKRQFFALTDLRGLYVLLVSFPKKRKSSERIATERLAASSIQHRTSERAWLNKTKRSITKSMTSTHDLRKRYLAQRCGLARNHFSILSICSVGGLCALWHCTLKSVFPDHWGNPRR